MKKLKTFKYIFVKSLTKPDYYRDILSTGFSFSLKYLFFLLFFSSLLLGAGSAINIARSIPKTPGFIEKTKTVLSQIYPEELVLTVKNKEISTNVEEPYFIAAPEEMGIPEEEVKYLMAIDTSADASDLEEYQSLFLLGKEFVAMKDGGTGYRVQPLGEILKDIPDGMSINSSDFKALTVKIDPYYRYLNPIKYVGIVLLLTLWPLLIAGLELSGRLIMLVFYSLFLFLFAKISKRALTYKNVYQLSMHGLTVPIVMSTCLAFIDFNIPYISLVAFLIWMVVVVTKQKHSVVKSGK